MLNSIHIFYKELFVDNRHGNNTDQHLEKNAWNITILWILKVIILTKKITFKVLNEISVMQGTNVGTGLMFNVLIYTGSSK